MKKILALLLISGTAALYTAQAADAKIDAKVLWDKNCKSCHGEDGKGQTVMGKKAGCKDYTDAKLQEAMKDEKAFKSVKEGLKEGDKEHMKPFAAKLSDDEIKALIAHMRTFKK